jgi:hypothetical protein
MVGGSSGVQAVQHRHIINHVWSLELPQLIDDRERGSQQLLTLVVVLVVLVAPLLVVVLLVVL